MVSSEFTVERCSFDYTSKGLVFLDELIMGKYGLQPGDIVRITTRSGKYVIAKVAPPLAEDGNKNLVRMDRYLLKASKALIGDKVCVEKTEVPPLEKLVVTPLVVIPPVARLEAHLKQCLLGMPLGEQFTCYIKLPEGGRGCEFKVVAASPQQGTVIDTTIVEVEWEVTRAHRDSGVTFEDVGGLDGEVAMIRRLVELPLLIPEAFRELGITQIRGIILYGPPGAGKTHLTRAIGSELGAEVFFISGPEIIGTYYGETEKNLRGIFTEASHHAPAIILVDELDVVLPRRGESGTLTDTRMSTQFLELLDGLEQLEGVVVIGTTNRIEAVDIAARRPGRFDREIFIGPPTHEGRLQIMRIHSRAMPLSKEAQDYLPELAQNTHGFVGADLMELCREAGFNALHRKIGDHPSISMNEFFPDELLVMKQDFREALSKIHPSALREAVTTIPDVTWEDIGGLNDIKMRLRELVSMRFTHPEVLSWVKLAMGILLYGPPGTGKTLLAKAVANDCKVNFVWVKGPQIFSKWLGESEERIRDVFRVGRQVAPAIIFFDQIDAIAPKRAVRADTTGASERVVTQLLAEMDGIEPSSKIMVLAATNRLDLIDPALLSPGRFGEHIFVPMPDENGVKAILGIRLKGVLDKTVDFEQIVKEVVPRLRGFSGAEIEALCQEARLLALREADFSRAAAIKRKHLLGALEKTEACKLTHSIEKTITQSKRRKKNESRERKSERAGSFAG